MADCRQKDADGLTICPCCGRHYKPDLESQPAGMMAWREGGLIQNAFPLATGTQREQLMTGLCSDACWDKYVLGPDGEDCEE